MLGFSVHLVVDTGSLSMSYIFANGVANMNGECEDMINWQSKKRAIPNMYCDSSI